MGQFWSCFGHLRFIPILKASLNNHEKLENSRNSGLPKQAAYLDSKK